MDFLALNVENANYNRAGICVIRTPTTIAAPPKNVDMAGPLENMSQANAGTNMISKLLNRPASLDDTRLLTSANVTYTAAKYTAADLLVFDASQFEENISRQQ